MNKKKGGGAILPLLILRKGSLILPEVYLISLSPSSGVKVLTLTSNPSRVNPNFGKVNPKGHLTPSTVNPNWD